MPELLRNARDIRKERSIELKPSYLWLKVVPAVNLILFVGLLNASNCLPGHSIAFLAFIVFRIFREV